jgi:glycosyltransferase involved in cell wall biosynthesis/tetratricopeptide (TPR) repeat protein
MGIGRTLRLYPFLGLRRRRISLGALIAAGDAANAARSWKTAGVAYAKVLQRNPQLAHIWVQYGHTLKEQGSLRQAEEAYRQALALDDNVADTHLQLGHVLKVQGRSTEAISSYQTAYQLDPNFIDAFNELRELGLARPKSEATIDIEFVYELYGLRVDKSWVRLYGNSALAALESKIPHRPLYLNAEMLLDENSISPRLLDVFDEEFYFYFNKIQHDHRTTPVRAKCLLHFCEIGIDRFLQFNESYAFDREFYSSNFLVGTRLQGHEAYRHWLRHGLDQGWAPNERLWLRNTLNVDVANLDELYGLFNLKRGGTSRAARQAIEPQEVIGKIAAAKSPKIPTSAESVDLLIQTADLLALQNADDAASTIYQTVLYRFPESAQALNHYADLLYRAKQYSAARHLYNKAKELKPTNIWIYVNLAECHKLAGALSDALAVLTEAADCFSGDLSVQVRFRRLAEEFFNEQSALAYSEARAGRFHDAQTRLAAACRAITPSSPALRPPSRAIRSVAIIGNQDLPQCRLYRIEQKVEQLRAAGYSVGLYDYVQDIDKFISNIHLYQAVIFYRTPAYPPVVRTIAKANEIGLSTFYEIDDLVFDASEYPTSFESYGGQICLDEYVGLGLGVPLFAHAMSMCSYGIASTTPLAEQMAKHVKTGRVYTHRNGLSAKHEACSASGLQRSTAATADMVTIFYGSGTKAHNEDFEELVVPALVEIVRRHGTRVSVVIVGYVTVTEQLRPLDQNITIFDPIWNVDDYWRLLSEADINIAVLKPSLMADCKSEIKWLEAAMLGIPSVVSRTRTYAEVIEDGVSGFLCDTSEDWISAFDRLIRDPKLRQDMGFAAQTSVQKFYGLQSMAANLRSIFDACNPEPHRAKPTIVLVNVFYPPQGIGGATRVVHDNVRHLAAHYGDKFNIEVFASLQAVAEPYEIHAYVQDGIRVTAVTTPHVADCDQRPKDQRMRDVFGAYLDVVMPDLIHFHCIQRLTASVVEAASERGIPYVITVHDGWWISDYQFIVDSKGDYRLYNFDRTHEMMKLNDQGSYLRMMALRGTLFGARRVIAVSEAFASLYKSCGVPNVITISNGVSRMRTPRRSRSSDGRVRLGFIGGLSKHKGYNLIRNAFLCEAFSNLRLIAVDHSRSRGYFRRELWGTTPVNLIGPIPQKDIADLYSGIDVLLAPSIWPESYGLVTREASASGCWVIASDRGAIGEHISDGENGYRIDVSGISGLVRVLRQIDSNHLRHLEPPARRVVLRTSREQGDELALLYDKIVGDWSPRIEAIATRAALPRHQDAADWD